MAHNWPSTALVELLTPVDEQIDIQPSELYKQITVKLWGKGVILRGEITGGEIAAPKGKVARAGQFIISRIDARHGAFGLVPESLNGAIVTNDFPLFEINQAKLLPRFLEWISKTHDFVNLCRVASEGTTNRVRLKVDRLLGSPFPMPPLDEQRRIVAHVETLAARIAEARGLRQQTVEEAKVLLNARAKEIVSLVSTEQTALISWVDEARGGIQTGPFGAQLGAGDFVDEGHPVITIGNVQYSGLLTNHLKFVSNDKAQRLSRFFAREGDILFARMGTVGRCCVLPKYADGWIFNYHIIRVAPDKRRIDPRYIHWSIQSSTDVEDYLKENIRGATREGVNSKIVGGLPLRVPPLEEQNRIVAYLDNLHDRIDALKRLQAETAAELDALLPAVLDRAFRGELL